MRIALLAPAPGIPVLGPSGASAHLRGVAQAMVDLGHSLRIVASLEQDRRGVHGQVPVPIETVGNQGWPSWLPRYRERRETWIGKRVARQVQRGPRPELVYERWSLFSLAGRDCQRRLRIPWVLEINAPIAQERARFEELRDPAYAARCQAVALRHADRFVVVSPWLANWLEGQGVEEARIRLVPNGTPPLTGDRTNTRELLGADEDTLVLGFVGSMKPWHGAERLPELVAAVPGARGLVVGDGPVAPPPGVHCTGRLDEQGVADHIAAMDVGLLPYPADAPPWFCPLKLWAYRAQGTPVVATDVGDLRGWIGEGGAVVGQHDLADGVESWRGRRAAPMLRPWTQVVREALQGLA